MKHRISASPAILLSLCGLLVVGLALLPLGWFALNDQALFGRQQTAETAYTSVTPEAGDYYLLRQLEARENGSASNWTGQVFDPDGNFYMPANIDVSGMLQSDAVRELSLTRMQEMVEAGILPQAWYDTARSNLEMLEDTGTGGCYSTTDSLGFIQIMAIEVQGDSGSSYRYLQRTYYNMQLDSRTGDVVALWIRCPAGESLDLPDPAQVLPAWASWCGLEELGDWAAPADTIYAGNGYYSQRGQVLMTCSGGSYNYYDSDTCYLSYQMLHRTPEELPSLGQDVVDPVHTGPYRPVAQYLWDGMGYNTGDAYYYLEQNDADRLCRLVRIDYATATCRVLCKKPDCQHDNEDCPACFGYGQAVDLMVEGDTVYAIAHSSTAPIYEGDIITGYREYPGGFYRIDGDGASRTLLNGKMPDAEYGFFCYDGQNFYGIVYQNAARSLCLNAQTGEITISTLQVGDYIGGCINGYPVAAIYIAGEESQSLMRQGFYEAASAVNASTQVVPVLYDPATGRKMQMDLSQIEGNVSYVSVYDGWLYLVSVAEDGSSHYRFYNPRTGQTVTDVENLIEGNASPSENGWTTPNGEEWPDGLIYFYRYGEGGADSVYLNPATGQQWTVNTRMPTDSTSMVYRLAEANDGRWLLCTSYNNDIRGYHYTYALMDRDAFLSGSTDWQEITWAE